MRQKVITELNFNDTDVDLLKKKFNTMYVELQGSTVLFDGFIFMHQRSVHPSEDEML